MNLARSRRRKEAETQRHGNPPPYVGGYRVHGPNACTKRSRTRDEDELTWQVHSPDGRPNLEVEVLHEPLLSMKC
jgi:hypothetical protein